MKHPVYWLGIFLAMASDLSNNISSISQFGFYFATVAGQEQHYHGRNLVVAGAPVRLGYIMCFHDQHTLFRIKKIMRSNYLSLFFLCAYIRLQINIRLILLFCFCWKFYTRDGNSSCQYHWR
jgi:hypothetical protein